MGQFAAGDRAQDPGQEGQAEDEQHARIEPERLDVVEAALRETLEVLDHEEVVQKIGEARLHRHEPRRADQHEHGQTRHRKEPPHHAPPLHHGQPRKNHQPRNHDADQALGQHAQRRRRIGADQCRAIGQALFRAQGGVRQQQDRGGDQAGDEHVQIRELPAEVEQRLHQQGDQREAGGAQPGPAPREQIQRKRADQRAGNRGRPRGKLVQAEYRHRTRREPIEQRRLVKERQAVQRRREPVVRDDHLPRDPDIAAFVGQQQRAHPGRRGQPDQNQTGHDQGVTAGRTRGFHSRVSFRGNQRGSIDASTPSFSTT
ncbi:hypothetical protein GALL_545820 [mine drainage metagenome]|uniref:Uncharacterized protein n=1 Tax=mine drainage metagenome TaxID=410659 RepID=A0A1J5NYN8_9ZZZZ